VSAPAAKTRSEWREAIPVREVGTTRRRYLEATCPICGFGNRVSLLRLERVARSAAVLNVLLHLESAHAESVRS
jgi:hypothetical protein